MTRTIRVGSRDSVLAVTQSRLVMDAIGRAHPEVKLELVTMKTTGDRILDKTLDAIGGKGLFIKELDEALLSGKVDICVHSYKDMPVPDNPELPVAAVSVREDPRDALLLPEGSAAPDAGAPLGSSSLRRRLQLAALFPAWECRPVRGNVQTRLRKLDAGQYGGLVLAAAGLKRLGLWNRVSRVFSVEEILPAACQGMLAVQGRAGEDHFFLDAVHSCDSRDAALAERAFIQELDGGCTSPAAAYAVVRNEEIQLSGLHVDADGRVYRGTSAGSRKAAAAIGKELAKRLKKGDTDSVE